MSADDVTSCAMLVGLGVGLLVASVILAEEWGWPVLGFGAGMVFMLGIWRSESSRR